MEFDTFVPYGSGKAWYRIYRENPGIYSASLLTFEGSDDVFPPEEITLIRGVRHWTGSENDISLINDLGALIESNLSSKHKEGTSNSL